MVVAVELGTAHPEAQTSELASVPPGIIRVVQPPPHTPTKWFYCGAGAQRTGPGPGSLLSAFRLLPATPDLSFLTHDLGTRISALSSLLLISAPAGAICPALAFGRWLKGQTGSRPRGHLSGSHIKGKRVPPKAPPPQFWALLSPQVLCGCSLFPTTALGSSIF